MLAWEFLLGFQSEAVGLQAGCAGDATALPTARHSGVWIDAFGFIIVRLQRRKHRAVGSLLKRMCTCPRGRQFCVVHRVAAVLAIKATGEPLFDYTAHSFLLCLRNLLAQLCVPHASLFALKAFRAGKATAMVAAGAPLGAVLAAGEWKSKAILNYVNEDVFDASQFVLQDIDNSDNE